MSAAKQAAMIGGGVGLALAGWGLVTELGSMIASAAFPLERGLSGADLSSAISIRGYLHGVSFGLATAAIIVGAALSPIGKSTGISPRFAFGAAAAAFLISTFFMGGPAAILAVLALAAVFALGVSRLLPESAGMGERLAVAFAAIGALFGAALVPPLILGPLLGGGSMMGPSAIGSIAVLAVSRPLLWALLRQQARAGASPMGAPMAGAAPMGGMAPGGYAAPMAGAAPMGGMAPPAMGGMAAPAMGGMAPPAMGGYGAPPANVPVPRGWMWGYLHSRVLGQRAFGFLYVDPMGGPSFHVIADLSAPLDWAAMRAAGYRGSRTARLGGYETLYLHPGTESFQWQEFEKGGVLGTVVLALPETQLGPMGLPPMPPWAYHYLPRAA